MSDDIFTEAYIKPTPTKSNFNFLFKESESGEQTVILNHGEKGHGKTTLGMGLPGRIAVLCFDNKAMLNKKHHYNNDERIKVYNVVEYFTKSPDSILEASETTYEYIKFVLFNIAKDKPDWIMVDGTEILSFIAEMLMRKRNNVKPYEGISNRNLWKERKAILDEIHRLCLASAKSGVYYTVYSEVKEIIKDGEIVTTQKIPKYTEVLLYEADIVLHTELNVDKNGKRVIVTVENSKIDSFLKTGVILDMTDKKLSEFIR